MTFRTNRNNIELAFYGIAMPMMVVFCLIVTCAFQSIEVRQFAFFDSLIHNSSCSYSFWVTNVIAFYGDLAFFALVISSFCGSAFFALVGPFLNSFTFFALGISFLYNLGFLALGVPFLCGLFYGLAFFCVLVFENCDIMARFTFAAITVPYSCICVKLRDGFNLFALRTMFVYNWLRHDRYSNNGYCLELNTVQPAFSLFNFTIKRGNVNLFKENLP